MFLLSNIKLQPMYKDDDLSEAAANKLSTNAENIKNLKIIKKSVDARKKTDIHFVLTLAVELYNTNEIKCEKYTEPKMLEIPKKSSHEKPVIAGFGPAGMFAALVLARAGMKPVVLERGKRVDERTADINSFNEGNGLNVNSNMQFGEGGAGTFSDGKLGTGIKSELIDFIYKTFAKKGAPKEILYSSKPHIGSDRLPCVVREIRNEILSLGGEIRFKTTLTGIITEKGVLTNVITDKGSIETKTLLIATGHSARDTFEFLYNNGIEMVAKPFSVGTRIEHLQEKISRSQYGEMYDRLPAADYKLSSHLKNGLSVYTFCMCPGGYVAGAASEEGGIVTNGYSEQKRDGVNANSAVLVGVTPSVFGNNPMSGIAFQRSIERSAFEISGTYKAPCQTVGDFLRGIPTQEFKSVLPTYLPGVIKSDISACLPQFVVNALREGLQCFDKKIKGFAEPDSLLTAPETRSSSPLRIVRNQQMESNIGGIYPIGEGSGYTGGITSSAVDGIKAALFLLNK